MEVDLDLNRMCRLRSGGHAGHRLCPRGIGKGGVLMELGRCGVGRPGNGWMEYGLLCWNVDGRLIRP